jgi:hypothetical protein
MTRSTPLDAESLALFETSAQGWRSRAASMALLGLLLGFSAGLHAAVDRILGRLRQQHAAGRSAGG